MQLYDKYRTMFSLYGVDTPLRKSHFMAQIDHESNLKPQRESLYYTDAQRAKNIFKTPFKGKSLEFVSKYLRDSEKMANYVYANRMGNGDEFSDRKSTSLNSSHVKISYAVFCLNKKIRTTDNQ